MKLIFVEGIRIEKTAVRFHSKLRNLSVVGNNPNKEPREVTFASLLPVVIENAQRHFQGSLFGCFEYVPYIALTIVCTINVSIDCNWFDVSNPFTKKNILK